jgi:hypothetical protein
MANRTTKSLIFIGLILFFSMLKDCVATRMIQRPIPHPPIETAGGKEGPLIGGEEGKNPKSYDAGIWKLDSWRS